MTRAAGARFAVLVDLPAGLVLQDLGPWNIHLTITNDATGVVRRVTDLRNGRRLFYLDSIGRIDELVVASAGRFAGEFAGFSPGAPREICAAVNSALTDGDRPASREWRGDEGGE